MDWIKDYVVIFKDEIYNECVQINIKKFIPKEYQ